MSDNYFSAYNETSNPAAILKWLADEQTQELIHYLLTENKKPFKLDSSGDLLLNDSFLLWYTCYFNPSEYLKYMTILKEQYGGLYKLLGHVE